MKALFFGKRALVVGGSGGIGRAVSLLLGEAGAELVVHGRTASKAEETAAAVRSRGGSASVFCREIASVEGFVEEVRNLLPIDLLVCGFGPFLAAALDETTAADWVRMCQLNLALPGALASLVLPGMKEKDYGRILFFGGTGTDYPRGVIRTAAYAAAKSGLNILVKSLARETAGSGITANLLCPGIIETENSSIEEIRRYGARFPEARLTSATEIANFSIQILANDRINGSIIAFDAGVLP